MIARTLTLFLTIFLFVPTAYSQFCPPNLDFESGSFDNWECFTGYTSVNGIQNEISLSPSGPVTNRHAVISGPSSLKDPYGNFSQVCPYGGKYSVKLGNDQTNAQAEGLSYTFQVPPGVDTFSFTYFYAVVFQDPMHEPYEQPRFFVTAYDVVSGALINCASYDYISTGGIPGFKVSTRDPSVQYKEWSPVSIQFAGLANRKVRLEFKTADCTKGGHFGYAYVDVSSKCSNILATAPYCIESNAVILNAPYGFQSYTWYKEDFSSVIGNQQSLTLSPPPATNGVFYVDIVPYPGYGCRDTVPAIVNPLPIPVLPVADSEYHLCQYQQPTVLSATPLPGNDILWYTTESGGVGSTIAPLPSTAKPGIFTYYVSQKVLFGCESFRKKITVQVHPAPTVAFKINDDSQCEKGNQFLFTSSSSNLENASYTWTMGDGTVLSAADSAVGYTYRKYGSYGVRLSVQNAKLCSAERSAAVTVIAAPVASFTYPALICEKETAVILKDNSSVPGNLDRLNSWWWSVGGTESSSQHPAQFIAPGPGLLPVKLVVTSSQGCLSDTSSLQLNIRYKPVAAFGYSQPLCNNEVIRFANLSSLPPAAAPEFIAKWYWQVDGNNNFPQKDLSLYLGTGSHRIRMVAESNYGCKSGEADSLLDVHPKPLIKLAISDSCIRRTIAYQAGDSLNIAVKWNWDLGSGLREGEPLITRYYNAEGYRPLTLIGQTAFGCRDTIIRPFTIYENHAFAGRDTLVARNEPVQLDAHGAPDTKYTWTPAAGLNNPSIGNPVATGDRNQSFQLDAVTKEGCDSHSRIRITRYEGPDIYIPTAFSPNGDGNNDALRVLPVGISSFDYFAVYNRWGEQIFRTTNYHQGWDGTHHGSRLDAGVFVAVAQATDYRNRKITRKATVVLTR